MSPFNLLKEAMIAVPAVRYALGVAGIISVVAIVRGFGISYQIAALGAAVMIVLMTVLVVFARAASVAKGAFVLPALFLTWASLLITVAAAFFLLTSVFFGWPIKLMKGRPEESALQIISRTIKAYSKLPAYYDRSSLLITARTASSPADLVFALDSDFMFKRPDRIRMNSEFSVKYGGVPIGGGKYQLYCGGGTTYVYSLDQNQFMTFTNSSIDLFQQRPENDPIKQLALTVFIPYALLLATSEAEPLKRMFHEQGPTFMGNETSVKWEEQTRIANRWAGAPSGDGVYKIGLQMTLNESKRIVRTHSDLLELFHFVSSNELLMKDLGVFSQWFTNFTFAVGDTTYIPQNIPNADLESYFAFQPESDAKHVMQLPSPMYAIRPDAKAFLQSLGIR